jgi:tape measure domain-containing protein
MPSIDDKVVAMSFENSKFESGVSQTLSTLEKLKNSLKFTGATHGLDQLEAKAGHLNLGGMAKSLEDIKGKFSALSVAGIAAVASIASRATMAGTQFVKAFTVDPIIGGLHEYETQLNAVQTILSNTRSSGATLKDVNAALAELNTYADKTIYNFSEMTKNIGTFTAAGVDLNTATSSIKGIANLAALSGSNAQQASTAMYQLSQAISAGRVGLQDWNSVVNAGMGGTVFQRALAQTAVHMGALKDSSLKLVGPMKNVSIEGKSFRESIQAKPGQQSWLTGKVLTNTLKQLSGDLTDAQLKAQGYSDAQIKAIQLQAKMALDAATKVKTLSGVIDTAKEAAGSGWAQTWQLIFGDFGEARTLFTNLSNAVNGAITSSAKARNDVLKDWKALGGRTNLISGIKNIFEALGAALKPVKEAFRDIFPATTGKQLADATKRFREFTETLKIGPETANNLKRTFAGFFAVLDIGKQIVAGIFHVIGQLFSSASSGSGGFLELTGNIGDFLVSIDKAIKNGSGLTNFFDGLGHVLSVPIRLIGLIATAINGLFGGFNASDGDKVNKSLAGVKENLTPLQRILHAVAMAWDAFVKAIMQVAQQIPAALQAIGGQFGKLGDVLANSITTGDFSGVLDVIKTGLLGGIFLMIRKFFSKGLKVDVGGGMLSSIKNSFDTLTGSMQAMQTNIKANTLLKIAGAIGLLTASVVALSLINSEALTRSLTALAVGFGQLLGAMAILTNISSSAGFIKVPFIAASMILLAGAIDVLVIAVMALSRLNWEELAKGLGGVAGLLTAVSVAAGPLSANSAGLIRAGIGITAIGVAMNILALAVRQFGNMNWGTLAKGMAGIAGALVVIGAAANLFPVGMPAIGAGLVLVAAGLKLLASAVQDFGGMDWGTIGKGMLAIAGALVVIAGAMQIMPPGMVLQAAGLVLVAVALQGIARAVESMGGMSWAEIGRGLVTLGGAMVILAAGLTAMSGTLGGAAALAVASASLMMLVPALKILGNMSWGEIVKGMVALAGAFVVLGVAGLALTPVAPSLLALGVAMLAIGGGFTLLGAGITLIASGLSALAIAGPAGIKILISAIQSLVMIIPNMTLAFVNGLLSMVSHIAQVAPQFVDGLVKIVNSLVSVINRSAPALGVAFATLMVAALKSISAVFPQLVSTGMLVVTSLLQGIKNNIGRITSQAADIIVNFLNALAAKTGTLVAAGANVLVKLLTGIGNNISKVIQSAGSIVAGFVTGIANNLGRVVTSAADIIARFVGGLASKLSQIITEGGRLIAALVTGIGSAAGSLVSAGATAAGKFVTAVAHALVKLANTGAKAIVEMLNAIADAINRYEPQMVQAGIRIGEAIMTGLAKGIAASVGDAISSVGSAIGNVISAAKKKAHINSPSLDFIEMGGFMMEGLAHGLSNSGAATAAAAKASSNVIAQAKAILGIGEGGSTSSIFVNLGQQVTDSFAAGLLGDRDQINNAFTDLNAKVSDGMNSILNTIASENDHLKELRSARKPDVDAIDKVKDAITANKKALQELVNAHVTLTSGLKAQKTELSGLADQYVEVTKKLDDATKALETAQKARDDATASMTDQYATLPEIVMTDSEGNPIDPQTQLSNYLLGLQNQATAVNSYNATLEQLRKLGLDDATYQKLLRDGPADQAFANQLLAGGKTAVNSLNTLDTQLYNVSANLATNASRNLYQAGVEAAQGLVNGLSAKQNELRKAMEKIATEMIKAIKKKLHIRSPSKVFAEVGRFSAEGLAEGLVASSKSVSDAAGAVGSDAVTAMQKSMRNISDKLSANIDTNPTITPILDLTQFQKDAQASRISETSPPSLRPHPTGRPLPSARLRRISLPTMPLDPMGVPRWFSISTTTHHRRCLRSRSIDRRVTSCLRSVRP